MKSFLSKKNFAVREEQKNAGWKGEKQLGRVSSRPRARQERIDFLYRIEDVDDGGGGAAAAAAAEAVEAERKMKAAVGGDENIDDIDRRRNRADVVFVAPGSFSPLLRRVFLARS